MPDSRVANLLKRLHQTYRSQMDQALAQHHLTSASYAPLRLLDDAEEDGLPNAELARRAWVSAQTMHRVSNRLVEQGLLTRKDGPGREIRLSLTRAGRERLYRVQPTVEGVEARMMQPLRGAEVALLQDMLRRCLAGLGDNEPSG